MPDSKDILFIVTPKAEALLKQARIDPEGLIRRYLDGDFGKPRPITLLMNAHMNDPSEQVGRYELDGHGVIIVRRRRSGIICVMDGASVLSSVGGP